MNMPGFNAERSLAAAGGHYRTRSRTTSRSGAVVPAIPNCANCEAILDRCAENGGRPRALCSACAVGNCNSGEENPGGRCWYDGRRNRMVCDL
jgi:hypothetical protein